MGKWVKNNPIPAAERSWGIWTMVNEENYKRLKSINEEAASKKSEPGSNCKRSVISGTPEWIQLLSNNKDSNPSAGT
jgi:predicted metalloendopeptidase